MTDPRRPDVADPRKPESSAFERQMAVVLEDMGGPDSRFDAMSIVRIATAPTRRTRSQTMFAAVRFAAAGLLVGVVGTAALAIILQGDPGEVPGVSPSPSTSPEITDVVDLPIEGAGAMVSAGRSIWVSEGTQVVRVDTATRTPVETIEGVGPNPAVLLTTDDSIWAVTTDTAFQIDRATNEVADPIHPIALAEAKLEGVRFTAHTVAAAPLIADGALWSQLISVDGEAFLVGIDLDTLEPEAYELPARFDALWSAEIDGRIWSYHQSLPPELPVISSFDLSSRRFDADVIEVDSRPPRPCCMVTDDAIWVIDSGELVRVDLVTREITQRIPTDRGTRKGIVAGGAIWLPDIDDGTVLRADLESLEVTDVIPVGSGPKQPIVFDGALWVASLGDGPGDGSVSRISLVSAELEQQIALQGVPGQPLVFDDALWIPDEEGGSLTRVASMAGP